MADATSPPAAPPLSDTAQRIIAVERAMFRPLGRALRRARTDREHAEALAVAHEAALSLLARVVVRISDLVGRDVLGDSVATLQRNVDRLRAQTLIVEAAQRRRPN